MRGLVAVKVIPFSCLDRKKNGAWTGGLLDFQVAVKDDLMNSVIVNIVKEGMMGAKAIWVVARIGILYFGQAVFVRCNILNDQEKIINFHIVYPTINIFVYIINIGRKTKTRKSISGVKYFFVEEINFDCIKKMLQFYSNISLINFIIVIEIVWNL